MKTLYISDLDGTLLNSKASLSDDTRETINRLVEQGMFFTYATARSAISSKNVTEGLNLKLPIIIYNGTFIMDTQSGEYLISNYFGDEVRDALENYLETTRAAATPLPSHENALFLSTQRKRMGVQAIENMVKKYARQVTPNKKITPHKLRSTYGTNLYKETGDIYLVADVLGHKDVNTTRKHYADIEEERRRSAKNAVTLREKK